MSVAAAVAGASLQHRLVVTSVSVADHAEALVISPYDTAPADCRSSLLMTNPAVLYQTLAHLAVVLAVLASCTQASAAPVVVSSAGADVEH